MPQGSQDRDGKSFDSEILELLDILGNSGIQMRDGAAGRLNALAGLISRWNKAINLVSRKDIGRLVSYHFADSLSLLPIIGPRRGIRVLDVGGSNGLPGLAVSCVCPDISLLICDGRSKRAAFLKEACETAGPGNTFELSRIDDSEFVSRHAESFDLILARAVTGLGLLLRWCLPLLEPGGMLVAYKGSRCRSEVKAARRYFFGHGGGVISVMGSPMSKRYNSLRKFAIAIKRT